MSSALHPVILPVPPDYQTLAARERVRFLSRLARKALIFSEEAANGCGSGVLEAWLKEKGDLPKDDRGAPLPVSGWRWSLSHKPRFVAAVAAPHPVGIDIEEIRPRSPGLWDKIADPEERKMADNGSLTAFFRLWTAKEAVLKIEGTGLAGLGTCRLTEIPDGHRMILRYETRIRQVAHYYFQNHIAALTGHQGEVVWKILNTQNASFPQIP